MTSRHARRCLAACAVMAAVALPALAHPGPHEGLSLEASLSHQAMPWQALPLVGAAVFTLALIAGLGRRKLLSRAAARSRKVRS